jgi:DNA anti-recombination protein RmuC
MVYRESDEASQQDAEELRLENSKLRDEIRDLRKALAVVALVSFVMLSLVFWRSTLMAHAALECENDRLNDVNKTLRHEAVQHRQRLKQVQEQSKRTTVECSSSREVMDENTRKLLLLLTDGRG